MFIIYIYINDLPLGINSVSEQTLFADDSNGTLSNRNLKDFGSVPNLFLSYD
jgi:hypothetical protein